MRKTLCFLVSILAILSCNHKKEKQVVKISTQKAKSIKAPNKLIGCSYANEVWQLGNGLVMAPQVFEVFNDSLLTNKFGNYDADKGDGSKINLCPKFYKPDYAIIQFVCLDSTKLCYKVLVNYADVKYLPKKAGYSFVSWENYIITSMGVRRAIDEKTLKIIDQPLRKLPSATADSVVIPKGLEMFCPMKIKGDWLKVNYDCFYNGDKHEGEPCQNYIQECTNPVSGWIKWRKGNRLLIDIMILD